MGFKLYDFPMSPNGRKVRATAIELGIDLEIVNVDLMANAQQSPDYLKKNPNGKVPTLEDNGWFLFESSAIMKFLCEKKPEKGLYPTEPRLRAEVDQWLAWDGIHFAFESAFPIYMERMFRPMMKQQTRSQIEEYGLENLKRFGAVINGAIEGKQYLVGNRFTIADFGAAGTLMFRDMAKLDLSPYPHLKSYLARIEERDSWKRTAPPPMG